MRRFNQQLEKHMNEQQTAQQTFIGPKDSSTLLEAIRQHIDLPDGLIRLELSMGINELVVCKAEFYATKNQNNVNV